MVESLRSEDRAVKPSCPDEIESVNLQTELVSFQPWGSQVQCVRAQVVQVVCL